MLQCINPPTGRMPDTIEETVAGKIEPLARIANASNEGGRRTSDRKTGRRRAAQLRKIGTCRPYLPAAEL